MSDATIGELTDDFRARVKSELDPGERLLWSDRPLPKQSLPPLAPILIGGLSFLAVIIFVGLIVSSLFDSQMPGPSTGTLLALAVFLIVALSNAAIVWNDRNQRWKLAGTLYALTDRRAIIWEPEPWKAGAVRVQTILPGTIYCLHRLEYADGTGDVLFQLKGPEVAEEFPIPIGFRRIGQVRQVEERVRRVLVVAAGQDASPIEEFDATGARVN